MNKNLILVCLLCASYCVLSAGCSDTNESTSSDKISISEQTTTTVTEKATTTTDKSEITSTTATETTSTDSENDYHGLSVYEIVREGEFETKNLTLEYIGNNTVKTSDGKLTFTFYAKDRSEEENPNRRTCTLTLKNNSNDEFWFSDTMIQGGAYPILSSITPATTVILIEENEECDLGEILENPCEEDDDFAISFAGLEYVDTNNNIYYVCDDFEFIYEY